METSSGISVETVRAYEQKLERRHQSCSVEDFEDFEDLKLKS